MFHCCSSLGQLQTSLHLHAILILRWVASYEDFDVVRCNALVSHILLELGVHSTELTFIFELTSVYERMENFLPFFRVERVLSV